MQHPDSHHARNADAEPLTSIGARTQLPRRVRMLLEGTLSLCGGVLERVLTNTLDEFERQLFKDAERARNASEQHDVFAALREVKRGRADVAPRFMQHLESSLAGLDQPSAESVAAQRPPPAASFTVAPGIDVSTKPRSSSTVVVAVTASVLLMALPPFVPVIVIVCPAARPSDGPLFDVRSTSFEVFSANAFAPL